jgi:hypothetical protein
MVMPIIVSAARSLFAPNDASAILTISLKSILLAGNGASRAIDEAPVIVGLFYERPRRLTQTPYSFVIIVIHI